MKDILISFNNTYQSPGYPSLGLLHADTGKVSIIDLPPEIPSTGFLGLAVSSRFVFAGLQYSFDATKAYRTPANIGLQYSEDGVLESLNPCSLLVFDKINFRLLNHYMFQLVKDVHSFLLSEDETKLYVVSTGTDEVIEITLDGSEIINEKVLWRPEPDGDHADLHHLNSICDWNGDMIVSGFGKKEIADDWNSARNGFIYNVSQNKFLIQGLQQPHSLLVVNDQLAYCESKEKRVRFLGTDSNIEVGGYSRGLCCIGNSIFIGTSSRRQKSKSTGRINKISEKDAVGCAITVVSKNNPTEKKVIDLNTIGHEIYELLLVDNVGGWPLLPPPDYKSKFEEAWDEQRRVSIEEITKHSGDDGILLVVDDSTLGISKEDFNNQNVCSFIEKDGVYWGPPENDEDAIEELEKKRKQNSRLSIAFFWPSFWWLESYPKLNSYLQSHFTNVIKNDRINLWTREE